MVGSFIKKITTMRAFKNPDKNYTRLLGSSSFIVVQNEYQSLKDLV